MDLPALWNFSDAPASEMRFRDAAHASAGSERELALTQVARALGLQDRFAEGHAVLDAIPCGDGSDQPDAEVRVRVELERGRLLRSAGDPAVARPHFQLAAELAAVSPLEDLEIDALHMVALTLEGAAQPAATQAALERSRAATTEPGRRWQASLLNNLGMALAAAGAWPDALAAFEEALGLRLARGDEEATHVAGWMVAWALRNLGRSHEALARQLALKAALDARGASDEYVDEEIALLEADAPA